MSKSLPLVTIGITCFNAEDSIQRAMDSALGQNYSNLEIIVIDDASTDSSVEHIKAYETKGVKLYQHVQNKGAPSAYNSIIKQALGKYICFFDDDDFSHVDRVQKTVELLEQHDGEEVVCYCDRYIQHPNKKNTIKGLLREAVTPEHAKEHMLDTLCYQYNRPFYRENPRKFASLKQHGLSGSSAGTGIMTAPKELLERYLFDEQMYRFCDTELNLRMFAQGVRAINVNKPLMTQYPTDGVDKTDTIEKECLFYAIKKHQETYLKYGITYPGIISIDDLFQRSIEPLVLDCAPLITIGLVVNKNDDRTYEVIQSALNQSYENFEIIVVDNTNNQNSNDLLDRFSNDRFAVIKNDNELSEADCLNQIVEQAKGEYTVFFGHDDIALNHRVVKQLSALQDADENTICVANYNDARRHYFGIKRVFGELGSQIDADTLKAFAWHVALQPSQSTYLLNGKFIPFHYYDASYELMMGKTEIFKKTPFSSEFSMLSTIDFLLNFSKVGGALIGIREPLIDKSRVTVCSDCDEINVLIEKQSETFEALFDVSSTSVIARNKLKSGLIKRFAKIKRYI